MDALSSAGASVIKLALRSIPASAAPSAAALSQRAFGSFWRQEPTASASPRGNPTLDSRAGASSSTTARMVATAEVRMNGFLPLSAW